MCVCVYVYFSSSSGNVSSRKDETNARDTYVSSFPRAPSTSDSVRLKCREMLAAALRTGGEFCVRLVSFGGQSFDHCHCCPVRLLCLSSRWDPDDSCSPLPSSGRACCEGVTGGRAEGADWASAYYCVFLRNGFLLICGCFP